MAAAARAPRWLLAALLMVAAIGCGPTYQMTPPTGFSRFDDGGSFKMITADGVRLKAREVDNYPKATLDFWTQATRRHLAERGYAHHKTSCFKTTKALPGCTLDFIIPRGDGDWALAVTLFVVDKRLILVEVAGDYARYAPVRDAIAAALLSFQP